MYCLIIYFLNILILKFKMFFFYIRLVAHPFFYPPHHMTLPFQHHDANAFNWIRTQDLLLPKD
jgi:hypothetical protein